MTLADHLNNANATRHNGHLIDLIGAQLVQVGPYRLHTTLTIMNGELNAHATHLGTNEQHHANQGKNGWYLKTRTRKRQAALALVTLAALRPS